MKDASTMAPEPTLRLRAGTMDVTPSAPGPLAGYEARRDAESTGVLDPLEAGLLVLEDAGLRVAWLTLDAIAVPQELSARLRGAVSDAARRQGVGDLLVRTVASHTHSAPRGWVGSILPGHSGQVIARDADELVLRVGALADRVLAAPAEAVRATWTERRVAGMAANRLDPEGPRDDTAGALVLRRADGALRAVLFDVGAHPTVLGPGNLRWSADWPGAARRILRAALAARDEAAGRPGSDPVVMFLQGAAGDVSVRFTRRGDDAAEVARLGALAASAVLDAVVHDGRELHGRIRHVSAVLPLPRRRFPDAARAASDRLAIETERAGLAGVPPLDPRVRLAQSRVDGARVQEELIEAGIPETVPFPVSVVRIGDAAWVHLPVEPFSEVARRIRESSPFPVTRVVGYTDGYLGYFVDERAAELGTYEALSSLFGPEAIDPVVTGIRHLLEELS